MSVASFSSGVIEPELKVSATPKEPRDPLKLARYYQSLLDSGQFENRGALDRYLRTTRRLLNFLSPVSGAGKPGWGNV